MVAYAVHETGRREVIGIDLGEVESEAFWLEFLRSLRQRGLDGVRLAVSDDHQGLKAAIARVLACPWQRCTVHFVRSMHQHCRPAQRAIVSAVGPEMSLGVRSRLNCASMFCPESRTCGCRPHHSPYSNT